MQMKPTTLLFCLLLSLNFFACKEQTRQSEIDDAPCVIIKPEEQYVIMGGCYRAQIILTCDKPDSANQISIKTDPDGKVYFEDGKIYWEYCSAIEGEIKFHGELTIKKENGQTQTFPFEDKFYTARPFSVIVNNKLQYLIKGEENSISVAAPGFPSSQLVLSADNATIKRDNSMGETYYDYFKVMPDGNDTVYISVAVNTLKRQIPLGTFMFKVVDKIPIGKH